MIMHHNQMEFITRTQERLIICKSLNVKYNINRLKDKIHMINSIDTKNRVFDRFQYSFIIKILNGLDIEGILYKKLKKTIYSILKVNIIYNEGRLKAFLLRSQTRLECPVLSPLFSIVLEVLARAIIRQGK